MVTGGVWIVATLVLMLLIIAIMMGMRYRRGFRLAIAIALAIVVAYQAPYGAYVYVDTAAARIRHGMSRNQVRAALPCFTERRVPITDVPQDLRSNVPKSDRSKLYRYAFLSRRLSVHISYDSQWRVSSRIDTYE